MMPSPSQLLAGAKVPFFLVSHATNIRYLTGMTVSSGVILVTPRSYILFVDGRYLEAAKKKIKRSIRVRDIEDFAETFAGIHQCGIESDCITVDKYRKWKRKFKNTKFVLSKGIIEEFRRQKTDDELRHIRKALSITEELLRRVPSALRRKPTERNLSWQMELWARELGADALAFEPVVSFGTHTSRPHHRPTSRALQNGHIVQIDIGAKYRGYCADRSDIFFAGKPTKKQTRVLRAVEEARDAAMDAVCPGVSTHVLDNIAREVLKKHKFEQYFCHSLGHGVGLDIHEGVSISKSAPDRVLYENEVITIEPGVYIPGCFGIRLEETIIL